MAKRAANKTAKKTAKKAATKAPARKTAAKRTAATRTAPARKATKRASAKRERLDTGTDVRYAKRSASGEWSEMDDAGRAQRVDRRRAANKTVRPGYGDQGDQQRTPRRAAKKR